MTGIPAVRRVLTATAALSCLALPGLAQRHAPPRAYGPAAAVDADTKEKLNAVGYSAWSESGASPGKAGVTRYDEQKASPGYNLFTEYTDQVVLIDMQGHVVHTWKLPAGEGETRECARMLPDGSLISVGKTLLKEAWDSTEQWRISPTQGETFTHDVEVLDDGGILALSLHDLEQNGYPVQMESIERFSRTRAPLDSWSTWKALDELHRFHPPTSFDGPGNAESRSYYHTAHVRVDYYHANTLRVLPDTPLGRKDRRFRKGNWMIALRQVGLIAILDPKTKKVLWGWGPGTLDHPHSPVMLPDGQILVFDNGMDRGYSRVLKMNPATGTITWTYEGKPRSAFYTAERGFVQPLPNGDVLVTLSGKGQALELSPSGEVVWEFFHPEIHGEARRAIYRMIRYPKAMVDRLLAAATPRPTAR